MNKAKEQIDRANKMELLHEQNQAVLKANSLIQKTRYSLSLQEQKIILYVISKIEPNDDDFKYYEFDLKDLCALCGIEYHGENYKNFKNSIETLSSKCLWIDNGTQEILCHWVDTVIIDKVNPNIVYVRMNDKLKPYLLQLKNNYTIYDLSNTLFMDSKYSIRIYELLKSYAYMNKWKISIEELKKLLCLENKYTEYKDFRKRIIDKSIEEINKYTEINVDYTPIRNNRVITHLHFSITKKNSDEINTMVITKAEERKSREG